MFPEVRLKTYSRQAFISVFARVAECFPPQVLHDRKNIPVVIVKGNPATGKSLAVEAMIKTWSDGHSLMETFLEESRYMFMERYACHASLTVESEFYAYGRKAKFLFSANGVDETQKAKEVIENSTSCEGGAVFISDFGVFDREHSQGQWLSVDVTKPHNKGIAELKDQQWERVLSITACNNRILNDPYFQSRWGELSRLIYA